MAIKPQWKEPLNLTGTWGFDGNATPPWLMVGHRTEKAILLDFAAGLIVKNANPAVVTVREGMPEGQSRWFMITGKNPGRGFIEVRDPKNQAIVARLEISVKGNQSLRIGFYFVEDKAGDTTTRRPDVADELINELNSIYQDQTNTTFEMRDISPVKVNIRLDDVIFKGWNAQTKSWTGDPVSVKRDWNEIVVKGDRGTDFNVFFVPAQSFGDPFILTQDKNCLIEDGVSNPNVLLPHEVGLFLGCSPISDFNLGHHLMFSWTQNPNFNPRKGNFIPKACANVINP